MKKIFIALAFLSAAASAEPSADYMCQYVDVASGRDYVTTVVKFRELAQGQSVLIEINGFVMEADRMQGNPHGITYSADYKATFKSNVGVVTIPLTEDNCSVLVYPESRDI